MNGNQVGKHNLRKSHRSLRITAKVNMFFRKFCWPLLILQLPVAFTATADFICPLKHHIIGLRAAVGTVNNRQVISGISFTCSNGIASLIFCSG